MNWYGFYTLFIKEVKRFLRVMVQTVFTPLVTVLLYLLVFSSALSEHLKFYGKVSYIEFLVPGLIMMSILQNAFANTSSSLFQSKMTGTVFLMLVAPLSIWEFYLAFVAAGVVRALLVGIGVWIAARGFVTLPMYSLGSVLIFAVLGSAVLGSLGLIAAIWSDKWEHVSAFQNFVILPLSFLSGVFYDIRNLPDFWETVSYYNPFFYMIEGFHYGFLGISEVGVGWSLLVTSLFLIIFSAFCIWLLHIGYKLRG